MIATKCDLCDKFEETANPNKIKIGFLTYEACENCLEKFKTLRGQIQTSAKGERKNEKENT